MTAVVEIEAESDQPVASGSGAVSSSKQHTAKEWNAMYPHIVRLYIHEQRILEDVMQIMETRYNFKATQSMYKKRIGRWQLHKYKRRKRSSPDKADTTTAAESKEIQLVGRHHIVPIVRRTSAVTVPTRLLDIEIDRAAQILLSNMRRLTFMQKGPDAPFEVALALAPSGILAVTQLYVTFWLASTLFAKGRGRLAGKAVRMAFLMLEDIIKNAHFGLDWLLLDLLYDFVTRGQEALYTTLVAHLANVAAIVLPRHHPLNLIAAQLLRYEGADVGTLLQRAYFSKVDAVQSDPEVRATLAAQNRRVREVLIPDEPRTDVDREISLVIQGIKATHYELESQKGWTERRRRRMQRKPQQRMPSPPPSYSSPSSSSSSPSSSSSTSPPPSPMPSFSAKNDNLLLPEFIEERTRRSLARMEKKPDALTLGVADRLYFSEYNPEFGEVYKLKARAYAAQRCGEWGSAVRLQRQLLDVQREKTGMDVWGIIRELWALERLLLTRTDPDLQEIQAIRAEVDERATALLADIPDDAP
ncbi:Clr5 domain-containing protein [Xylaria sp. FL1777]|nr:Clr5 domain-containing protein [Xylaria sp. FL1777]